MAFDSHKNFSYSTVLTAPSPASSGTSLVVQSGDGAKFPTAPFNATVWPVGANPLTTNGEIVRATVVSTDTFTITRAQESSSARTIVVGDQIAATITKKTLTDLETTVLNSTTNYFASGCVWTGDAYASTLNASMTTGTVIIAGVPLTVAAVTSRAFTASKDTYVDFTDNGDGTAVPTYIAATTNAASSTLTTNGVRNAIIVTGATNIAAAGSINQGNPASVLPIASSVAYSVTDSLGNLICNRSASPTLIGYRQRTTDYVANSNGAYLDVPELAAVPVIVPVGRKIDVEMNCSYIVATAGAPPLSAIAVREGTTIITQNQGQGVVNQQQPCGKTSLPISPTAGLHTYKGSVYNNQNGNTTWGAAGIGALWVAVKLV